MNKLAAILMAAALVTGCADNKVIPGYGEVETYGVIDEGSLKTLALITSFLLAM